MWTWINENSSGLNLLVSLGTMVIWIAYFQLLYGSYTRQRRTKILINRGAGDGIESRCLVSNMGAEPLYIITIIAILDDGKERIRAEITDRDSSEAENLSSVREGTSQGPLMSGEFMDVGRFSELMARCARANRRDPETIQDCLKGLELIVIGAYGAEDLSVGATRSFTLDTEGETAKLLPDDVSTRQLRSRRDRRKAERYLQDQIRPSSSPATG